MSAQYRYPSPDPPPLALFLEDYEPHKGTGIPIVIDNGASNLRYGFASAAEPFVQPNIVSRYKDRRITGTVLLFGEAVDIEATTRTQSRTPWEGDLLLNFDAMESAFDYMFIRLALDTQTVEHSVIMTERLASPIHSRQLTSELLFELYNVPSVCYAVDGLMSFSQNLPPNSAENDGLVVSFNTFSTSIIPILDGKGIMSHSKRLPWGASQASEYMLKLVNLKHPTLPMNLKTQHSNWMMRNFCEFAPDYRELVRDLSTAEAIQAADKIIQMPYASTIEVEKSDEELARIAEKRKEAGRKLREQLAKKRAEKLAQREEDLARLNEMKEKKSSVKKSEWMSMLRREGFDEEGELEEVLHDLDVAITKARRAEVAAAAEEPEEEAGPPEEPTFPLLDVPDADLDEDQIKEKRRQRLLKAGYEGRMRAKAEKERLRREAEEAREREQQDREDDPEGWRRRVRSEHDALVAKLKERKRRRAALSDRKSAAAQARMKNIANLAAENAPSRKRRKVNTEDDFGADDADWAIYRSINTRAQSSDEEEDESALVTLETKLLEHDPAFTPAHTYAAQQAARGALVAAVRPPGADARGHVHLAIERWRVPETWWQPSLAGIVDAAGIGELLGSVLQSFEPAQRARLAKRVFATGAPALMPGIEEKLRRTIRPLLAPEVELGVFRAVDPQLDAWRGMAAFSQTEGFADACLTRAEYDEHGGERCKRWWGGNWNGAMD
ncbi:actin-like ATPase domain-containing protein [Auriculariales sp. MPI-PUGE-AT-0066]|nr:actin-like ATPase domain-containing protein [Auriculariales sp. MPI-PUGE-AT-0066]